MGNLSNYTLNLSNLDPLEVCRISQAEMLEQTAKIPKVGYYIIVLSFLALFFYLVVQPRLSKGVQDSLWNSMGFLALCFLFLGCWVLFFSVFQISEESLTRASKVGGWLMIPLFLFVGWSVYSWVKKSKGVQFGK